MNLNNYYKKLPKNIQNSEKFLYYSIKLSKFIQKRSKSTHDESNSYLNFIIKSTDIKANGFLRDMQLMLREMLIFIDNVCKKYDLDYIMAYGSLLGAVRHKGFIPWDDDMDIVMMRKDYNKLIEVLPDEISKIDFLKDNFGLTLLKNFNENSFEDLNHIYSSTYVDYFYSHDLDYRGPFLQIACLNPFVKIDIFPFDFVKDDSIKEFNKNYLTQKYIFEKSYKNEDFVYKSEFDSIAEKLGVSSEETNFIGEGIDATKWEDIGAFKKDVIYPIKQITFENHSFKCPNNPDKLLKLWYGDSYMDLPPSVDSAGFVEYNKFLFKDDEELENLFKTALNELKLINESFNEQ